MVEIDLKMPESECILQHTQERMRKKKGMIILFTGETGEGKSYAGLRFLELWYRKWFEGERFPSFHICENLEQAVLLVQKFNRAGEGLLIEELSVLIGRRDSLTNINKLWNKFVDMCRIKQAVIVGNCPHISFIDKHFVLMCQSWVNCVEVQFKKRIVVARPLWLQQGSHKNEPYRHKYISPETMNPIDFCYFRHPEDKELVKKYDEGKLQSFDTLSEEIVMRMQKNRLEKFKELGRKKIPRREAQAYELYLKGESQKIAAKIMGLTEDSYKVTLSRAKQRLKMIEYEENALEIKQKVKNKQEVNKKTKDS